MVGATLRSFSGRFSLVYSNLASSSKFNFQHCFQLPGAIPGQSGSCLIILIPAYFNSAFSDSLLFSEPVSFDLLRFPWNPKIMLWFALASQWDTTQVDVTAVPFRPAVHIHIVRFRFFIMLRFNSTPNYQQFQRRFLFFILWSSNQFMHLSKWM